MDYSLWACFFLIGGVFGGLVVLALMSDRPRHAELHSYRDDVEARSRRLQ
jgi:hypothetical protein